MALLLPTDTGATGSAVNTIAANADARSNALADYAVGMARNTRNEAESLTNFDNASAASGTYYGGQRVVGEGLAKQPYVDRAADLTQAINRARYGFLTSGLLATYGG